MVTCEQARISTAVTVAAPDRWPYIAVRAWSGVAESQDIIRSLPINTRSIPQFTGWPGPFCASTQRDLPSAPEELVQLV